MSTDIGRELADLKRRMGRIERASRLGSASLDGTALEVRDPDTGGLRGIVGVQADGTTAVTVVNGAAPPAPSTPTVAPALGGVAVTWDGTLAGGATLPLDWSRIEVHASATDGFTPDPSTLQATIETPQGATVYVPATAPQYVVLLARNTSGTASDPSAQAGPYEPRQVVDADVADGSITEVKIADDAVTAPKIKAGEVQAEHLAAESVTTAALAAGSVDAVALAADAITGKTITGGTITGAVVQTAATGHRIVLDDADGTIKVYNDDDKATNCLGGDVGVMWNQYGWDDIPGSGTPEWVAMFGGNLMLNTGSFDGWQASMEGGGPSDSPGALGVLAVGWALSLTSPEKAGTAYTNAADLRVLSGKSTYQSGTVDAPAVHISGADLGVTGAAVKLSGAFDSTAWRTTPETWHAPTLNSGWSLATSVGTLTPMPALRYRLGIEDTLILEGSVTAASTGSPSPTITNLPIGYRPQVNSAPFPADMRTTGGTTSTVWLYVSAAGNLNINGQTGSSITLGATYSFPRTHVSLGNIA